MASTGFPRLVSLACHDLRTPLATVYGFARTLSQSGELDERSARFVGMIEQASGQMSRLLDDLGTAARIAAGRWEPSMRAVETLELATSTDERIETRGEGATVETDPEVVGRALEALALAAVRHGPVDRVVWEVRARELALSPVLPDAAAVVAGEETRDLGAEVARLAIEALGGSLQLDGQTLLVRLY
jgi:signal transduction histidine kinase